MDVFGSPHVSLDHVRPSVILTELTYTHLPYMRTRFLTVCAAMALLGAGCAVPKPIEPLPAIDAPSSGEEAAGAEALPAIGEGTELPGDIVYTLDEVAQHATTTDCWVAINGKVYEMTGYITGRSDDTVVRDECGKNATQRLGSRTDLMVYEIGTLTK